jgi:hypothetical protein
MKVFVKDARLRRHSVDVDDGASVAHLKLLLANMSLVPAGFVPNLVYQTRNLSDGDCVSSIGYSPDLSISLVCVKAAPASAAADHKRQSLPTWSTDANPLASVQKKLSSSTTATNCTVANAADSPPFSSTKTNPATPVPSAAAVREGSRVRIEGLQAKPEMNGRTGLVRGAFDSQSGRWTVEVAADEAGPSSLFSFRPANLCVIEECASSAPPSPAVNVATEWLDELGCVCPKAVDYASQCPKGHALVPFAAFSVAVRVYQMRHAGGICGALEEDIIISHICRICHTRAECEQAKKHWLMCSVAGCCAGYTVCDGCVRALHQAPAAVAAGEGFSSQVNRAVEAARCFG